MRQLYGVSSILSPLYGLRKELRSLAVCSVSVTAGRGKFFPVQVLQLGKEIPNARVIALRGEVSFMLVVTALMRKVSQLL